MDYWECAAGPQVREGCCAEVNVARGQQARPQLCGMPGCPAWARWGRALKAMLIINDLSH
jgi:hypothetical protein